MPHALFERHVCFVLLQDGQLNISNSFLFCKLFFNLIFSYLYTYLFIESDLIKMMQCAISYLFLHTLGLLLHTLGLLLHTVGLLLHTRA